MLKIDPKGLPRAKGETKKARFMWDARQRMAERNFDPLTNLIDQLEEVYETIQMWEEVREGLQVPVGNGKFLRYDPIAHDSALQLKAKINTDLMKYAYVPPKEEVKKKQRRAFVINVSGGSSNPD